MIEDKFLASIKSYNYKDSVQQAISSFNAYKANNITVNSKNKKDDNKGKLGHGKNKFKNTTLKHCNTSEVCNRV